MSEFYVYMWRNLVNGKCYVGKGKGTRAQDHMRGFGSKVLRAAVKKYGEHNFELRYLSTDMDEKLAYFVETETIRALGCKGRNGYNQTARQNRGGEPQARDIRGVGPRCASLLSNVV